jgi:hypothetical protein
LRLYTSIPSQVKFSDALSRKQELQMIGNATNQPIKKLSQLVVISNSPHDLLTTQNGS